MGEVLKKIQEINMQHKMLQSVIGKKDVESNINRIEKLIFILAEEMDKIKTTSSLDPS